MIKYKSFRVTQCLALLIAFSSGESCIAADLLRSSQVSQEIIEKKSDYLFKDAQLGRVFFQVVEDGKPYDEYEMFVFGGNKNGVSLERTKFQLVEGVYSQNNFYWVSTFRY